MLIPEAKNRNWYIFVLAKLNNLKRFIPIFILQITNNQIKPDIFLNSIPQKNITFLLILQIRKPYFT